MACLSGCDRLKHAECEASKRVEAEVIRLWAPEAVSFVVDYYYYAGSFKTS